MTTTVKVSAERIRDALGARPGASAAGLAEALGIGQSTAAKHLAALEATGAARREPGGRDGARRLPDRWFAVAEPDADPGDIDGGADPADGTHPLDPAVGEAGAPGGRLGRGALGTLVREYLAARPGEDLGPTQVGKGIGRSPGAVSNALARLEAAGEARLVSASPRRYRLVSDR